MDLEKLLKDLRVLEEGHFLLNSGLHSKFYFQKFRILENPEATTKLCRIIADHFKSRDIDWVIGPTTGGIVIAFEIARQMNLNTGFAEEQEGKRVIRRGFDLKRKNVLVVDDVMTTGKSLMQTLDAVKEKGARNVSVAVLIDRSKGDFTFEYFAAYRKFIENFEPDKCPMCQARIPLSKHGGL